MHGSFWFQKIFEKNQFRFFGEQGRIFIGPCVDHFCSVRVRVTFSFVVLWTVLKVSRFVSLSFCIQLNCSSNLVLSSPFWGNGFVFPASPSKRSSCQLNQNRWINFKLKCFTWFTLRVTSMAPSVNSFYVANTSCREPFSVYPFFPLSRLLSSHVCFREFVTKPCFSFVLQ